MRDGHGAAEPRAAIVAEIDGKVARLVGMTTEEIVDLGIALVPEGRRLFPRQTVEENLLLGASRARRARHIKTNLDFCFETLPAPGRAAQPARRLDERRRAADAGAGARADAGAAHPADRRAFGGSRARAGEPHHRRHQAAQGPLPADGADGGAELHPGPAHRRPRLCHRARQNRIRRRLGRRAQQQRFDPRNSISGSDVENIKKTAPRVSPRRRSFHSARGGLLVRLLVQDR